MNKEKRLSTAARRKQNFLFDFTHGFLRDKSFCVHDESCSLAGEIHLSSSKCSNI